MGRTITAEHMDDPNVDRGELGRSLRFIRAVNRRLGGTRATLAALARGARSWPADRPIRIIDIGTGSADIPLAIARWGDRTGRSVHVTAVDRHPATIAYAREHIGDRRDITLVEVDALGLMDQFDPGAFDYAHAGMFLHHFGDVQVLTLLRIMERLSRVGLIWNDLVRGSAGRLGVRLLTCGAPAMVKHDARVSVEAGFTRREVLDFARRLDLERPRYRSYLGYRFTLVSEKQL